MKALIHNGKVIQLSAKEFEVHSDLVWVDATEEVKENWLYVDGVFSAPPEPPPPPAPTLLPPPPDPPLSFSLFRLSDAAAHAYVSGS